MRIHGQAFAESYTRRVELPRPDGSSILLTLSPLPLGFHRQLHRWGIVPPQPPTRVARDSAGKPMRDEQGLAVLLADQRDPGYVEQLELYYQRVAVLVLAESLKADPNVTFETPRPEEGRERGRSPHAEDWSRYADALYEELNGAGFSAGDLIWLCNQIAGMSNLAGGHLQEAGRNFSSAARGAS